MKGVILAGGLGTRLRPATLVTNKHLLPVFDRPMIFFAIETLRTAGIREILIISGPENAGDFARLLSDGSDFNCDFTFKIQKNPGGIADALKLAENFARDENLAVILGDNIFTENFENQIKNFKTGAQIFLKKVDDANRFGVAILNEKNEVLEIIEKPKNPPTNFAVTGFYIFDATVFAKIQKCKKSARGEIEISDVNNFYIAERKMRATEISGEWTDAGTPESLLRAANLVQSRA